jgi:P-type Cu+ transporter
MYRTMTDTLTAAKLEHKRTVIKIGGMHCAGCVNSIQELVSELDGVKKVEVNLATEKAAIEFDPTQVRIDVIEKAIEEVGYTVVYNNLVLKIGGITDSSDSERIEKSLKLMEGIKSASVNYGSSQINFQYNPALISSTDIRRKVVGLGYEVLSETSGESAQEIESKKLLRLLYLGVVFTIPIVLFSYPEVFSFIPLSGTTITAYLMFALGSVVQFVTGSRFYIGALRIAKMKSANMDTLVVLGTTAAYIFSAYNTFPVPNWNNLYYDAAAVVITFIILGKYMELKTKGRTSSTIKKLLELQPKTAKIKNDNGEEVEIPIEQIQSGNIIVVRPGEKIPVDSTVILGSSAVDESMVSGESMPISRTVGDFVIGGSINREGMIMIKATKVGADSFLSQVVKLVEEAMGKKPAIQKIVDKVAGYFAYAVMGAAFLTFTIWFFIIGQGIAAAALIPTVAILVVACPCALGLATPTAIMVGMGKAAANGVIFKGGDAMEQLSKISVAVFDKTGTLTKGKPQVTDFIQLTQIPIIGTDINSVQQNNMTKDLAQEKNQNLQTLFKLTLIAEKNSEHPLAKSIVSYIESKGVVSPDIGKEFEVIPGRGITVTYDRLEIRVGSPKFILSQNIDISSGEELISRLQKEGKTTVLISVDKTLVGLVGLLDTPKLDSKDAILGLKKLGIESIMLTGDNEETAREIAKIIGINRIFANVLPSEKVDVISSLQKEDKRVAMIGDGINDAPALTAADVGIAIGSGTDVAIEAGNVVLIRNDVQDVVTAIEVARKTVSKIKQNLLYAFAYNIILIPVAASGFLYPALAGIAMAASSVSVTMSSLALKRWNPKRN